MKPLNSEIQKYFTLKLSEAEILAIINNIGMDEEDEILSSIRTNLKLALILSRQK